jgi:hypothetical protein
VQTEPVASLRQAASGPALANLDLALAFPLADNAPSFLDRLEAASSSRQAEASSEEKSRRAEKEQDQRSSRSQSKKSKAESDDKAAMQHGRDPATLADHPSLHEMQSARRADQAPATGSSSTDSPATDSVAHDAGEHAGEQAGEARANRGANDDRRAAKPARAEERSAESAPAEPSMRQTRLEAESSRRVELRDQTSPPGDAPSGDAGTDGRQSAAGGGAWQAQQIQRQAPAEAVGRDGGAIKATGAVRETQGPATGPVDPRVGHGRSDSPQAGRAKEVKRQAPRFPAPQAQESTMVLRTGKALAAALRGAGDVRLNLSPEELGRVQVRMHSDQEGVSVVLGCERPDTVASLESGVAQLRRSLEEQGVRVKDIVVEGPRSPDAARPSDASLESASHDRPASGFDQGARDDGRQELPARRGGMIAPGHGDVDAQSDTVAVDASVGTLLASLGAAGVSTAIDTVI